MFLEKLLLIVYVRFIARRGYPKRVVLDNGKVFVADYTQRFSPNKGISWKFTLAKAS